MIDFWIETIIFIQTYWWLRSPSTGWNVGVYFVVPSGDVYYVSNGSVNYSYGSPDTHGDWSTVTANCVLLNGTTNYAYGINDSYGISLSELRLG